MRFPALERRLLSTASNEIAAAQDQMLLLGRKTALERLATFLLMMQKRGVIELTSSNYVVIRDADSLKTLSGIEDY